MSMEEIRERLKTLCEELFCDSGVDTDLMEYVDFADDLGMDSVTFISLIIEIEAAFNITVPDEMLLTDNFNEFDAIAEIISEQLEQQRKGGDTGDKA